MRIVGFALLVLSLALPGCASIIRGTSQSIAITSPPANGAECTLTSAQGSWSVITPGVVAVERSKEDIQARCVKAGYDDGVAMIPSNFEGWTVGNLVFGGLVGVGVDAATGAINQYPKSFQIPMHAVQVSVAPPVAAAAPATEAPPVSAKPAKPAKPSAH